MIVRCRQRAPEPSSPGVWRTRSSPASGMSALVDRAVAPWIVDRGGCAPSPGRSGRSIAARRLTDRASSPGFIELAMHAVAQPFCLLEAMGRQEDRDARSRSPSISSCTSRAATGSSPEDSWIVQQRPRRATRWRKPFDRLLHGSPARCARPTAWSARAHGRLSRTRRGRRDERHAVDRDPVPKLLRSAIDHDRRATTARSHSHRCGASALTKAAMGIALAIRIAAPQIIAVVKPWTVAAAIPAVACAAK